MCVRRNAQHHGLKLPKFTRFVFATIAISTVSTSGPTGCPVRPPPLSSQNIQPHEISHASHTVQGQTPIILSLVLGETREGKERVKGKASRGISSRIGSALVCVCWNAQHFELKLPESPRFMLR